MMTSDVVLRDVIEADLPIFFEQQLDPDANQMAAFTARDPANREAFMAHWTRILGDKTVQKKTILFNGQVAGHILSFEQTGKREVGYWIGKEFWGKGIATRALSTFLDHVQVRPLYARAAKDNIASIRVLEKCGFTISGESRWFSNARGQEVEEYILKLSPSRFGMFGKLTAHPGQRDALVQHLLTAAQLVGSASGCELYVVNTSPTEPDTIWVMEAWRSQADHEASLSLPGVRDLIAKARPLIAVISDPILTIPVGGKGLPASQ